jgi:hypothetical protein
MVNISNWVADIYQHIMWKKFSLFLVCQSVIQLHILPFFLNYVLFSYALSSPPHTDSEERFHSSYTSRKSLLLQTNTIM